MTVVRKANRIIRVTDNELARYLANGYEIVKGEAQSKRVEPTPKVERVVKESPVEKVNKAPTFEETPKRRRNKQ